MILANWLVQGIARQDKTPCVDAHILMFLHVITIFCECDDGGPFDVVYGYWHTIKLQISRFSGRFINNYAAN